MVKNQLKSKAQPHIHYFDYEQGSEEWKEGRKDHFTGSNAHKLLSSFGAGRHAYADNSSFGGNFYTKRGHLLETEAIELYEQIKEVKVGTTGFVKNDKYKRCLYSPDGFLPDRTLEVKCFSPEVHLKTIKYQDIKILSQCHFGQLILEKDLTDLILYCPDDSIPVEKQLVIITIKKDKDIRDNFKRIVEAWND